jgi:hypothetical protein
MTPTDAWILKLLAVYSLPAFLCGIAVTLLFVHWRSHARAMANLPRFLSPELTFEQGDLKAPTPTDDNNSLLT